MTLVALGLIIFSQFKQIWIYYG